MIPNRMVSNNRPVDPTVYVSTHSMSMVLQAMGSRAVAICHVLLVGRKGYGWGDDAGDNRLGP